MRRPHNSKFKYAVDELRTAAGEVRRAQAAAADRYDPELRTSRAHYARVRAKVVMASAKAQAEDRRVRLGVAWVVFNCAVALVLAVIVGALSVPFPWWGHAGLVGALAGLVLAGAIALILNSSPTKMRDDVLLMGLQAVITVAHWLRLLDQSESRIFESGRG